VLKVLTVLRCWRVLVPRVLKVLGVLTVLSFLAPPLSAQTVRIATTAEALVAAPVFFHGKQIVVRTDVVEQDRLWRIANTAKPIYVFWKDRPSLASGSEIRGEFWDVGRLPRDDPRFSSIDLSQVIEVASHGQWPARDQVFMIVNATMVESPLPTDPTLRAVALSPEHYANRAISVVGRFRGANLFGDLPQAVGKSRWDFVLQSADSAVWVTGLRPRGKGFDLDVQARVDTGHWLQVSGTLRHDGALTWIEATSIAPATAPTESPIEVTVPRPPEPPPTVVFTAPIAGETDADRSTPIRIQFSRDIDPRTIREHIRVTYTSPAPPPAGAPASPPSFTARYNEGNHSVEIKFAEPLDRYRGVKVDLLEGILSNIDNQPLAPWSLAFTTGG
jgi:hypothetical protein